jgi:hypothetical protein
MLKQLLLSMMASHRLLTSTCAIPSLSTNEGMGATGIDYPDSTTSAHVPKT